MRGRSLAIHALLFASGAAGLVYEVCWSRQLALRIGLGERGQALTLAAFFAGMTLGYWVSARLVVRVAQPLRAYAVCELVIGAWALLLPPVSAWVERPFAVASWLMLLPPTIAMGASLPFALEAVARQGGTLGQAYALQLLGATLGCLLAPFALIPALGVWGATQLTALLSVLCALVAWLLARKLAPCAPTQPVRPERRFLWAAALAGALTLALQVLAIRLFALTFHNSTYTFALTAAGFIVLLAAGSRRVARAPADASPERLTLRNAAWAAVGVVAMGPLFALVTRFGVLRAPSFAVYVVLASALVLLVLALPVTAAGALLPALWRTAEARPGHTVAVLSAVNGAGGAAGALAATFVLLPRLGLFAALALVAVGYALLWVVLAGVTKRSVTVVLAVALGSPLALYAEPAPRRGEALLARWQTSYGFLDLVRVAKDQTLSARLDLHYQIGASSDHERYVRMGALPLALHPAPRRVLFVGLATGMTASSALESAAERIDIVELVPEMAELAARFAPYNGGLVEKQDARVKLIVGDGRAFLRARGAPYDAIVSDLFVPWHSHAGYLYTLEHYRAVRARLAPFGVFAQFLPLSQLSARELVPIANSFARAFGTTSLWLDAEDPEKPVLALIGFAGSAEHPFSGALGRVRGVELVGYWLREERTGELNTDEHPRVEFTAPRTERSSAFLTGERLRTFLRTHVAPPFSR